MKAKEYYSKYGEKIYKEAILFEESGGEEVRSEGPSALSGMFCDFVKESRDIIMMRHSKKDEAAVAVLTEQNQKWNSICRLFKKEYGRDILKEDALLEYFKDKIPEIEVILKKKREKKLRVIDA